MKQMPSERRNVAWFTLAECVARGEKERALGVYRLLSHSLDDAAVTAQLEGDLLWAFNDPVAVEKYFTAAARYQHDGRYREAVALLEHIRTLTPESIACLVPLMELSDRMHADDRLLVYLRDYLDRIVDYDSFVLAHSYLERSREGAHADDFFALKIALALKASTMSALTEDVVLPVLYKVADECLSRGNERQLQRLTISLEHSNAKYHQALMEHLKGRR